MAEKSDGATGSFIAPSGTDLWISGGTFAADPNQAQATTAIVGADGTNLYIGNPYGDTDLFIEKNGAGKSRSVTAGGANLYIYNGDFSQAQIIGGKGASSITIYGGDFLTVAGSTWSEGATSGNVDIKMYGGSVANDVKLGISGAGVNVGDDLTGNVSIYVSDSAKATYVTGASAGGANLNGSTSVTLANGAKAWALLGGNSDFDGKVPTANAATINGSTSVKLSGGYVGVQDIGLNVTGKIYGLIGGGMDALTITGNSSVLVEGGEVKNGIVLGGNIGKGASSVNSANVTIRGGDIDVTGTNQYGTSSIKPANGIFGGSAALGANAAADATVANGATVRISGGSISGNVFGGGLAMGANNTTTAAVSTVNGGSNVVIDGAAGSVNISGNIYGGGFAKDGARNAKEGSSTAIVNGGSKVTVDSGANTIKITGDIYGGGLVSENAASSSTSGSNSVVNGGSAVNFQGDGSKLTFTGTVYGGGQQAGKTALGSSGATVEGLKTLNFGTASKAFNGEFAGKASGFDSVNIAANSSMTWSNYGAATNDSAINNYGSLGLRLDSSISSEGLAVNLTNHEGSKFNVYGGYMEAGKLFLGEYSSVEIDVSEVVNVDKTITHAQSSTMVFTNDEQVSLITMEFSVAENSTATFNSMRDITEETFFADVTVLSAWDFDIDLGEGNSVVLSFLIGDVDLEFNKILLFHDGVDVSANIIGYDGETLTFLADGFSSWAVGYSQVPEPSTYAAIFGAIALAFAAYRRRARR